MRSNQPGEGSLARIEIFNVRMVRQGERYGLKDCLVHDRADPLVEFYDARASAEKFGPRGQFVSRYFATTLMGRPDLDAGLLLDTGSHDWCVGSAGMRAVMAFIRSSLEADRATEPPLVAGDKVFVSSRQKLATVLDVYGDGWRGADGDVRLDLCGNTSICDIERYDPVRHAPFDSTFVPIKAEWKAFYGIAQDVPVREAEEPTQDCDRPRG